MQKIMNAKYLTELEKISANITKFDHKKIDSVDYRGQLLYAVVVKVIDGDTVKVVYNTTKKMMKKTNIRLFGIDAPELKSKNKLEANAAQIVKKFLEETVYGKVVLIELLKHDKYGGRYLAKMYSQNQTFCYSDMLLSKQYVKQYYGAKKEEWSNDFLNKIVNNQ